MREGVEQNGVIEINLNFLGLSRPLTFHLSPCTLFLFSLLDSGSCLPR
jgi:hypothetical protein